MGDYEAVFCPNCGVHLNDYELDDPPSAHVPKPGAYRCGWCHKSHDQIEDVALCRKAHRNGTTVDEERQLRQISRAARHHQARAELIEMYRDLMPDND